MPDNEYSDRFMIKEESPTQCVGLKGGRPEISFPMINQGTALEMDQSPLPTPQNAGIPPLPYIIEFSVGEAFYG